MPGTDAVLEVRRSGTLWKYIVKTVADPYFEL
jgi:hypothetical protein